MKRSASVAIFVAVFFFSCNLALAASQDEQQAAPQDNHIASLAECVAIALDSSPQILYSQANIFEKESSLKGTRKDLLPSLFFQYGYKHTPDADTSIMLEDYYNYGVSIEQPLYQGGALVTGVELGKLDLELSRAGLAQTRNDTILSVHDAYYNLLKTRKFEGVAKQSVNDRKAHLKDATAYYKAGLIPKNDMLQSEVQLANAEIEHIQAMNMSNMALARLNTLLRRPVDTEIELEDILEYEPSEISWEQAVEQAKKYRPELRQSEIAIEQAQKNIIMTRAPYLPSISVSANYTRQGDDPTADEFPLLGSSEVKTAMATLDWRFWAWGQSRDKIAAARHTVKKAQENQSELLDNIILQVREAYLDIKESEYNIGVTKKAIEQAEEDFRINQSRYQAQLSTTTDVLDAQTRLARARILHFDALYTYRISLMKLAWASGTLTL